ncbi:MAG: hypothetical protein KatS3mg003_0394 [Candidatus Nitrosocaldaceae archaeon]|nr:MAG: hypothetical protein KatS3mg003_0394 [Candidatus Nitrosocaldaceae archaeon]
MMLCELTDNLSIPLTNTNGMNWHDIDKRLIKRDIIIIRFC